KVGSYPSFTWRSICCARDVFDDGLLWWIGRVIYRLFYDERAWCILNIPIAGRGSSDLLVWRHDASGEYSVKSGYRSLITNGKTNFVSAFLAMDMNSKKLSAVSLWALWYKRNKLVNEGLKFEIHEIVGFIQSYGQDLSFIKTKGLTAGMKMKVLWRPPKPGFIKLNFDSSFVRNTMLAKDSEGLIMGACTHPMVDVADAFVAEARACERALYFVLDMGFKKVVLEGDSLTVIKKLNSNITDRSVLNPISQHIRVLAGFLEEVTYIFVLRKANKTAHELALVGWNQKSPCFW
ncbi:hypothetical protein Goari_010418, partial [Gossypium aridum]|nr:hypothetical protein [Gossypium aridum]